MVLGKLSKFFYCYYILELKKNFKRDWRHDSVIESVFGLAQNPN